MCVSQAMRDFWATSSQTLLQPLARRGCASSLDTLSLLSVECPTSGPRENSQLADSFWAEALARAAATAESAAASGVGPADAEHGRSPADLEAKAAEHTGTGELEGPEGPIVAER